MTYVVDAPLNPNKQQTGQIGVTKHRKAPDKGGGKEGGRGAEKVAAPPVLR